jgi:hypothetical protein
MITFGTVDVVLFNSQTLEYDGLYIPDVPLAPCITSLGTRVALAEARTIALTHVCAHAGIDQRRACRRLDRILKLWDAEAIATQLGGLPDAARIGHLIRERAPEIKRAESLDQLLRAQSVRQLGTRSIGQEFNRQRRWGIDTDVDDIVVLTAEAAFKASSDLHDAYLSFNKDGADPNLEWPEWDAPAWCQSFCPRTGALGVTFLGRTFNDWMYPDFWVGQHFGMGFPHGYPFPDEDPIRDEDSCDEESYNSSGAEDSNTDMSSESDDGDGVGLRLHRAPIIRGAGPKKQHLWM